MRKSSRDFLYINDTKEVHNLKKHELLNLKQKPKTKSDLYKRLLRYTNRSYPTYDEEFTIKIKRLQPNWFLTKNDLSYQKMLSLMPECIKFKQNQQWLGVAYKHIFIHEDLGEFKRTPSNLFKAWKKGLSGHPRDSYIQKRKLYGLKIKNKTTGEVFKSIKDASEELDIIYSGLIKCLSGRQKKAGGYEWEYCS